MPLKKTNTNKDKSALEGGSFNKKFISIIYHQKNDSPKYFEIKKSKLLFLGLGIPTLLLISLTLGFIGLIHTSPFHLIDNYRQNILARKAISQTNSLIDELKIKEEEKNTLTEKLTKLEEQLKTSNPDQTINNPSPETATSPKALDNSNSGGGNLPLLSALSLFKPVLGQKDLTRPATLNLSGFNIIGNKDTTNFQFNIIPVVEGESKLTGYIVVLMKNELTIQAYPKDILKNNDPQMIYSFGEAFSTQRFRPVDASFLKPKKAGNYTFLIYIFARNGDLLHYQSIMMPVKF